jgi:hypothetical protein
MTVARCLLQTSKRDHRKSKCAKGCWVGKAKLWADGGGGGGTGEDSGISLSRLDVIPSTVYAQITFCEIESLTANCLLKGNGGEKDGANFWKA